ncbi:hypothetical protein K474DRAFT_1586935, partial [Panus rudis PR-1116 ss-1]
MLCGTDANLIRSVYSGINEEDHPPPPDFFQNRVILAPRNDEVHNLNTKILERFPGAEQLYISAD